MGKTWRPWTGLFSFAMGMRGFELKPSADVIKVGDITKDTECRRERETSLLLWLFTVKKATKCSE